MDPMTIQQAKIQISKAKAALILEQPFFAALLVNMPMVEDQRIKTMATNGKVYKYNPAFITSMDLDETKFVMCHEVGHCILQHMYRKGARNHRKWNKAGDFVINDMLVRDKIGKMPVMGLYNPQLVKDGGNTTDGVYDLLPDEPDDDGKGPGDQGEPMDDCEDAPGGEAEVAADAADMKVRVAQAAQAAKMCGKLSADQERMADLATKAKVDYTEVMRRFVSSKAKTDISYSRPKRKYLTQDIYLPGLTGLKLGVVGVYIDCSGSVYDKVGEFGREVAALHEDCQPEQTVVSYFDTKIKHTDIYEQDDALVIKARGGGGTAFSPIWKHMQDLGIDPVAVIVLTDLECDDFGEDPGYPVLWVSIEPGTAPFGEVVLMNPKM